MRCNECGFRIGSKNHAQGEHHIKMTRKSGVPKVFKVDGEKVERVTTLPQNKWRS